MRHDVAKLLGGMGREAFNYNEFFNSMADVEMWPVFEELLADERIVGRRRKGVQPDAALPFSWAGVAGAGVSDGSGLATARSGREDIRAILSRLAKTSRG